MGPIDADDLASSQEIGANGVGDWLAQKSLTGSKLGYLCNAQPEQQRP